MADRKRRTAPSREFIREREESSRNRRPSRNRYQEDYDSDDYDNYDEEEYDDEYEDDYDEDY
ncbi:MAG: LytR family transcriptional regulator, partial [Oribacterium sinus]|nr:LytR family transcriptional regulator [Oribacterium sinus]